MVQSSEHEYIKHIEEALVHLDADRIEDLKTVLSNFYERIPINDVKSLMLVGSLFIKSSELSKALYCYRKALESEPDSPNILRGLGRIYLDLSEFEKAQDYLSKSLSTMADEGGFVFLGICFLQQDLISEARKAFKDAIRLNPNFEEAYYNLAVTYIDSDPDKAIGLFNKAIEIDVEYSIAYRDCGWCLNKLKRFQEASDYLHRAIESDRKDYWSYIYLGNTLWASGELVSAEKAFRSAIEVSPENSVSYWSLAFFYDRQNKDDDAVRYYRKSVGLDPDDVQANLRFGVFLKKIGEPQNAMVYLKRATKIEPNNKQAMLALREVV